MREFLFFLLFIAIALGVVLIILAVPIDETSFYNNYQVVCRKYSDWGLGHFKATCYSTKPLYDLNK